MIIECLKIMGGLELWRLFAVINEKIPPFDYDYA